MKALASWPSRSCATPGNLLSGRTLSIADGPAAAHVEHDGQIHESCGGRGVGDIGPPPPVRRIGLEAALDQVPWGSRRVVCAPLRRLTPANPASRITRVPRLARLPTASWISPPHRGQVSTTAALLHPSGVAGTAASLSDTLRDSPSLHLECVGSCTADGPALSAARACPETPHGRPGADNRSRRRRRSRSVKRHRLRRRRGLGSRRSAERASQGRVVEQAARLRGPDGARDGGMVPGEALRAHVMRQLSNRRRTSPSVRDGWRYPRANAFTPQPGRGLTGFVGSP